jgi:hypothetical protein
MTSFNDSGHAANDSSYAANDFLFLNAEFGRRGEMRWRDGEKLFSMTQ